MNQRVLEQKLRRYLMLCNRKKRYFVGYAHLSKILRIPLHAFIGFHDRASSDFGGMGPAGDETPKNKRNLYAWARRNCLDYLPVRVIGCSWFVRKRAKAQGLPTPEGRRVCLTGRQRMRSRISHKSLHKK